MPDVNNKKNNLNSNDLFNNTSTDIDNIDEELSLDMDMDIDLDIDSFNDSDFLSSSENNDIDISDELDKFEIDNSLSLPTEENTLENLTNKDAKEETEKEKLLSNELDLELNLDIPDDFLISKGIQNENLSDDIDISLEENLDIKSDLGLKDELSLSTDDEEINLSDEDFDFNFIDDTGNIIDEEESINFEEEFGVALKSGPETIVISEENLFDAEKIIEDEEFSKTLEEDKTILNVKFPEKKPLTVDDEQFDFLNKELTEENIIDEIKLNNNITDNEIDNLSLEDLEENALSNAEKNKSLISDEDLFNLEAKEDKLDLSEDIIETDQFEIATLADEEIIFKKEPIIKMESKEDKQILEKFDEEIIENDIDLELDINLDDDLANSIIEDENDESKLDTIEDTQIDDILTESDSISSIDQIKNEDFDINLDTNDFDISAEIAEIEEKLTNDEDFSIDEEIKLEDKDIDITLETSEIGELNFDEDIEKEDLETEIKNNMKEEIMDEDEKIILDQHELLKIEDSIFPEDNDMPQLDEEIKNISLVSGNEDLENSISPLSDSSSVFSEEIETELETDTLHLEKEEIGEEVGGGDLADIDLESIPKPSIKSTQEEDESIGLSGDELDNILSSTEIVETIIQEEVTPYQDSSFFEDEFNKPLNFEEDLGTDFLQSKIEESIIYKDIDIEPEINLEKEEISGEITEESQISFSLEEEKPSSNEEETETIDLSHFDADFTEEPLTEEETFIEESKITITEEIEKEEIFDTVGVAIKEEAEVDLEEKEESVTALNISEKEEEEIYNSLKQEMQKKTTEEEQKPDSNLVVLKEEVKTILSYLDQLLDALPEEKIKEFAESKTFDLYRKLFDELNIKH